MFCFVFFYKEEKEKKKTHFPFFLKTLHDFDELFMFCFCFFGLLCIKKKKNEVSQRFGADGQKRRPIDNR